MSRRLEVEQVTLGDLKPYPGNARRGDVDAIVASLTANGQFRPLVVQRSTGYVLGGNHTLQAAQRLAWPSIQVTYVDVDDDAARRIVLADNRTADLGGYDEQALLSLLREVGEDLDGTGYDLDDFDDLLASIQEADEGPQEPTVLVGVPAGQAGAYGEGGDGTNTRRTPSYSEYEEAYSSRATRFMALNYPLPQYAWIVERLTKIAADEGVDNFAEAVLRLVEQRTGETAPPLEEGETIGEPPTSTTLTFVPPDEEPPGQ
jgi:hypothetical protein